MTGKKNQKTPAVVLSDVPFMWAPLISSKINGLGFSFHLLCLRVWCSRCLLTPWEMEPSINLTSAPSPNSTRPPFFLPFPLIASASFPMVHHPADKPHFCQSIAIFQRPPVHSYKGTLSNTWPQPRPEPTNTSPSMQRPRTRPITARA